MMPKCIRLSCRDHSTIKYVFEQKVVSFNQIHENFFYGLNHSTSFLRLKKLIQYDFLKKFGIDYDGKNKSYYTLGDEGLRLVANFYTFDTESIRYKSDSVLHDLRLSHFRNIFEKLHMVGAYFSENYIHNCYLGTDNNELRPLRAINSDAAIKILDPKGDYIVSLEYEKSLKNLDRYERKLTDYYYDSDITAAFYICENRKIARAIKKIDIMVGESFAPKIYTIEAKNVQEQKTNLPFMNRENDIFLLS